MKSALFGAVLALGFTLPARADIQTYFGYEIGTAHAPAPPVVVFREYPEVARVRGSEVYVVENDDLRCDMFRYGRTWYVCHDDRWYRASRYNGPFQIVDVRYVPRAIFYVPAEHWRHRRLAHAKRRGIWTASEKEQGNRYKYH